MKRYGMTLLIDVAVVLALAAWLLSSAHPTLHLA
jgi:hypothetical protein